MDTEKQQETVSLDPQILVEVQAEQIRSLTDQNIQLGAYVRQLKRELDVQVSRSESMEVA